MNCPFMGFFRKTFRRQKTDSKSTVSRFGNFQRSTLRSEYLVPYDGKGIVVRRKFKFERIVSIEMDLTLMRLDIPIMRYCSNEGNGYCWVFGGICTQPNGFKKVSVDIGWIHLY